MRETVTDLTAAVDRLSDEAADLRTQLRARTRALWTAVTVGGILLAMVLAAAVAVTLNNSSTIARNNLKFCPLIQILIPRPGEAAPSTPRGAQIAEDASRVSADFGC